jgi:hypothetical protein
MVPVNFVKPANVVRDNFKTHPEKKRKVEERQISRPTYDTENTIESEKRNPAQDE